MQPPKSRTLLFDGYLPLLLVFLGLTIVAWYIVPSVLEPAWAASAPRTPTPVAVKPSCPAGVPTSDTDYRAYARYSACKVGIDPDIFERQINQESGFNPHALSTAGAQGIAQFMPTTAEGLGINPWNPKEALDGSALLMSRYIDRYGEWAKALAAYNAGSGRLQQDMNHCGEQWRSCLPAETQHYITVILQEN